MFRTLICSMLALLLGGCALAPLVGPIFAIGVAWANGEAHKYYHTDQQNIANAVKNAVNDLEFIVVEESVSGNTIHMKVDDRSESQQSTNRFKIRVIRVQHNVTKLSIRINTMGDKPYAELIYRKVDKYPGVKCFKTVKELEKAYYAED